VAGVADASGAVDSIFSGYRELFKLYRKQVTGDPEAVRKAAKQHRLQVASIRSVADAVVASSTKLAADWEAPEQKTFGNDVAGLATRLTTGTAQALSSAADRLTAAAAALTTARVGVDNEVTLFTGRASMLLARARNVSDDQVQQLLDAAKRVGVDSARVTQGIARDLSKALAMLFGLRSLPASGPFGPDNPLVVAVIGNSYGVGEGVGEGTKDGKALYFDARDRKHRSPYSAALQALELVQLENRNVPIEAHVGGSSGAVTRDVVTDQTYEVRMNDGTTRQKIINEAQLFQIPPNAKVVIADFGGNDAMFSPIVEAAAGSMRDRPAEFTRLLGVADEMLSDTDPKTGKPYTVEDYRNQAASHEVGKAPTVVARWLQIIDEIRERAPDAKIAIPTYPDGVDPRALDSSKFFSATQGREIESHLLRPLNAALERVVEIAGPGVSLADVTDTLRGHEAYTKEPWMNGLDPFFAQRDARYENTWAKQEPFHPNAEGYGAMSPRIAKSVADLTGLTAPPIPPEGTITRPDHIRVIQGIPDFDGDGIHNNLDPTPGTPQFQGRVGRQ
jgi:lysophospholipase L1-like esterase